MRSDRKMSQLVNELDKKRDALSRYLKLPGGVDLMAELERVFVFGELQGDDALETAFNLGAREVVMRLRALRDFTPRTGE